MSTFWLANGIKWVVVMRSQTGAVVSNLQQKDQFLLCCVGGLVVCHLLPNHFTYIAVFENYWNTEIPGVFDKFAYKISIKQMG